MTDAELIERLTRIVKEQAEIIGIQSRAVAQFGEIDGLEERIRKVAAERAGAVGV